jgi:hypothetical protein
MTGYGASAGNNLGNSAANSLRDARWPVASWKLGTWPSQDRAD